MHHLTPDELVDLAEDARAESAAPHLASCERCRRQLADLRATMGAAGEVEVPEPSPLFWDHLSARVHDAIAADGAPGRLRRLDRWSWTRAAAPLSLAALILLAVIVTVRVARAPGSSSSPTNAIAAVEPAMLADDPSLDLVADLSGDVDLDAAGEGLSIRDGAADRAVTLLTDSERIELRKILEAELRGSGN